jgi:hypothetical protein
MEIRVLNRPLVGLLLGPVAHAAAYSTVFPSALRINSTARMAV